MRDHFCAYGIRFPVVAQDRAFGIPHGSVCHASHLTKRSSQPLAVPMFSFQMTSTLNFGAKFALIVAAAAFGSLAEARGQEVTGGARTCSRVSCVPYSFLGSQQKR